MKNKKRYSDEGIELVECYICRNYALITRAGKFRGDWFCDSCYLMKLERQINEWKSDFKHFRNGNLGMLDRNELLLSPKLSIYIN